MIHLYIRSTAHNRSYVATAASVVDKNGDMLNKNTWGVSM